MARTFYISDRQQAVALFRATEHPERFEWRALRDGRIRVRSLKALEAVRAATMSACPLERWDELPAGAQAKTVYCYDDAPRQQELRAGYDVDGWGRNVEEAKANTRVASETERSLRSLGWAEGETPSPAAERVAHRMASEDVAAQQTLVDHDVAGEEKAREERPQLWQRSVTRHGWSHARAHGRRELRAQVIAQLRAAGFDPRDEKVVRRVKQLGYVGTLRALAAKASS